MQKELINQKNKQNMRELKCPKCGNVFSVDEADYASIVNQVKGAEFDAEVNRRLAELHHQQQAEEQARAATQEKAHQSELFKKDQAISAKESEIVQLKEQLSAMGDRQKLAVGIAVADKDKEITALKAAINKGSQDLEIALLKERQRAKEAAQAKDAEIAELRSQTKLAASEAALREKQMQAEYEGKLQVVKSEAESRLRVAEDEVQRLKDFKTRLSTKMVGESLEAHCSTVFESELRVLLPKAYFEKDNDASGGSKGDFIFRDYEDDMEYVSIMFEMKNEMDETATKHKNEDFFKKLDADRTAKGCEYAVLVSLLEPESELYNSGIVDVSHRYPKMYVIRPQFFKAIITLLVNAAKKLWTTSASWWLLAVRAWMSPTLRTSFLLSRTPSVATIASLARSSRPPLTRLTSPLHTSRKSRRPSSALRTTCVLPTTRPTTLPSSVSRVATLR